MTRSINSVLKAISESVKSVKFFGVVSGNQSGDLDSIVSAISYAYFNHISSSSKTIVPLLNFTKKELHSRKDVLLAFKHNGVDSQLLFYVDDIPYLIKQGAKELILVDHNTPQGKVRELLNELPVVGIIDHHEDEGEYKDIQPRIIKTCGSCSSLVFNYWFDQVKVEESDIIKLLIAPLVIDTTNLSSKVEESDIKAFKQYQKLLTDFGDSSFDVLTFFKSLKESKNDIEGLSLEEILSKDYKVFEFEIGSSQVLKKIGISSIVKPFDWLFAKTVTSKSQLYNESLEYLKKNEIDILVFMTSYVSSEDEQFCREIAFLGATESDGLLVKLAIEVDLQQELELKQDVVIDTLTTYRQLKVSYSRKQVAPALKRAFERL